MKHGIVLGMALLAGMSAAVAQMSDWTLVVSDQNRAIELDRTTIAGAGDGVRIAWARIVLTDSEAAVAGYAMIKALNRFDCERRQFVTVRRLYLDSAYRVLREEAVANAVAVDVGRGGADEQLWREVCQPPNMRDFRSLAAQAARAAEGAGSAPAAAAPEREPETSRGLLREQPVAHPTGNASVLPATDPESPSNKRLAVLPASAAEGWSYAGPRGPQHWGRLRKAWKTCAAGKLQSPIALPADALRVALPRPRFEYRLSRFTVVDRGVTLAVHPAEPMLAHLRGRDYRLERVEFRLPAEEVIDGRRYPMSLELIHRDGDGREATVVVPMLDDFAEGHAAMQAVLNALPLRSGQAQGGTAALDFAMFVPPTAMHYVYEGSQTQPPCHEGVLRVVMLQPLRISGAQREVFQRLYPQTAARPVQPLNGRRVLRSH